MEQLLQLMITIKFLQFIVENDWIFVIPRTFAFFLLLSFATHNHTHTYASFYDEFKIFNVMMQIKHYKFRSFQLMQLHNIQDELTVSNKKKIHEKSQTLNQIFL